MVTLEGCRVQADLLASLLLESRTPISFFQEKLIIPARIGNTKPFLWYSTAGPNGLWPMLYLLELRIRSIIRTAVSGGATSIVLPISCLLKHPKVWL